MEVSNKMHRFVLCSLPYAFQRANDHISSLIEDVVEQGEEVVMRDLNDHDSVLFRVWILGPFCVERRLSTDVWEPVDEKEWGSIQTYAGYTKSLLGFLLTYHKRTATRATLLQRLWSHMASETPLYRATARLRALLSTPDKQSLLTTGERFTVADQASIWVDADHAEALVKEAETIGPTQPAAIPLLEEASDLFQRGRFLEQEDGTWCLGRRGEIERLACRCHHWLADAYLAAKDDKAAEAIANLLLRDDPLDETGGRVLLLSLHRQGLRREAVRAYQEAKNLYQQQQLPIPEEIEAVYQQIQRNRLKASVTEVNSCSTFFKYKRHTSSIVPLTITEMPSTEAEKYLYYDVIENSIESLRRLLAKGEVHFVLRSSLSLYNKLLQEYPTSKDMHLIDAQFRLGMLVGAAQEYLLPWYQRDQIVLQTYNHIEDTVLRRVDGSNPFRHEYARLMAKRGRHNRVLWQFEAAIEACEDGLTSLQDRDDPSLQTLFFCERAHIEATRGDELVWMRKIEEARKGILHLKPADYERALKQVEYIQGEGYKRFAFHMQKDFSMSIREKYVRYALDYFTQWQRVTIELPGFEDLVSQVSKAQCLILVDADEAVSLARQLEKHAEQYYPSLLDKIHRVLYLAQQRLHLSSNAFSHLFQDASLAAYRMGRNIL